MYYIANLSYAELIMFFAITEKGKLKDLVILRNEMVYAALEVFELDQDLGELVDTFKRICRLQQISGAEVATSL